MGNHILLKKKSPRIEFPGRPIFIQLPPERVDRRERGQVLSDGDDALVPGDARRGRLRGERDAVMTPLS